MSLDQYNASLKEKKYSFLKNILLSQNFWRLYTEIYFTGAETVKKTNKIVQSGQTEIWIIFSPNNSRYMIKHNISCSITIS